MISARSVSPKQAENRIIGQLTPGGLRNALKPSSIEKPVLGNGKGPPMAIAIIKFNENTKTKN